MNVIDWTEENRIERIRLYQELGKIIKIYRIDRASKKWYHKILLQKENLTG